MNPVNPLDIGIAVSVANPVNARGAYTGDSFSLNEPHGTLNVGDSVTVNPFAVDCTNVDGFDIFHSLVTGCVPRSVGLNPPGTHILHPGLNPVNNFFKKFFFAVFFQTAARLVSYN